MATRSASTPREFPHDEAPGPSFADCLAAGLNFLSYRPRTVHEVRQRLRRRFEEAPVERAIAYFLESGLLDDAVFARQWRSSRERRRPKGSRALKQELRRLGVEQTIIEAALEGIDEAANAYNAGNKAATRLIAKHSNYGDFRRKMVAHLQRRGFSYGTAAETAQLLWAENGEV